MSYLSIENFNKTFSDGFTVLNDISFSIEKGQALSIIGSSGSGKTTLLRCINFLTSLDSGKIVLDGETLFDAQTDKELKDKQLREKRLNFGLVFQSFNLFPQYNVLDNITLAPKMLLKDEVKQYKAIKKAEGLKFLDLRKIVKEYLEKRKKEIEAEGLELLAKIGLTEKVNSYPCELSGGQCQRVAIARALALKPKVLCFDEPTSALDPELTGEVLKVIKELKKTTAITMIIVTHEMGFAKSVSDKVLFMVDGEIEEIGTPKQVFENSKSPKLKAFLSGISNKDGEE